MFHLQDTIPQICETHYDAITLTVGRQSDGRTACFTFCIPLVSFGVRQDRASLHTEVISAFDAMADA